MATVTTTGLFVIHVLQSCRAFRRRLSPYSADKSETRVQNHLLITIFGVVGRWPFADFHLSQRHLHRKRILRPMFFEMVFETVD